MKRKCDKCENDAVVHEVKIEGGQKIEKHLCEECAREEGMIVQSHAPIGELITKFVISQPGSGAKSGQKSTACAGCGLTYAEFRQHGLLGCPDCYATFESQLGTLLERAHEGATHHVGKVPVRAGSGADRHQRIALLRRQLSEAIEAEQYEKAAKLRDEIMTVGEEVTDKPRHSTPSETTNGGSAKTAGEAE